MARTYIVFGSNDGRNWEDLGEVVVGGAPQAIRSAMQGHQYRHYATVTKRNWKAVTPEVENRPPVVKLKAMKRAQLTVEDVLETS